MDTATEKKEETTATEKKEEDSSTKVTVNLQNQAIIEKLRELDTRTQEAERKLKEAADKAPEKTVDEKTKLFFNDPVTTIQEMLNKTVKPLIEFRDEFKAGTEYDRVKNEFKNDPRFKDFLAKPGIEVQVDKLMEKNQPTRNDFLGVLLGLRGGIEMGLVPKPEGYDGKKEDGDNKEDKKPSGTEGDNKETKVRTEIPPHLRPSSSPAPKGDDKEKPLRELNESEERLRIENKLTKREFIELTDEVGPADVVGWQTEAERNKKKEDK